MRDVRHPHLLGVFGVWQEQGHLILALELADKTLMQRFEEARRQGLSGIPRDELWRYMYEAARALDHLNNLGIQHRDVKPQNILLVGGGVKVADCGLAKLLDKTQASNTGHYTPFYAAPEFFSGSTSNRSDQYCLAISYCQLRGGHAPFEGNLHQLAYAHLNTAPDLGMLPEEERAVVGRALAKKPEERWPSCLAFVKALTAGFLSSSPVRGYPHGQLQESTHRQSPAPVERSLTLVQPPPPLARAGERLSRWHRGAVAGTILLFTLVFSLVLARLVWNRKARTDIDAPPPANRETAAPQMDRRPGNGDERAPKQRTANGTPSKEDLLRQPGEERDWEIANGVRMKFYWIPPGTAQLGAPKAEGGEGDEAEDRRGVYTSAGFWMGKYAVTQQEWAAVMDGHNPSGFCRGGRGKNKVMNPDTSRFPVESVTWDDCQKFLMKLNGPGIEGDLVRVFHRPGKFALPHEDEWEYACRGGLGNQQPYYFGHSLNGRQANCYGTNPFGTNSKGPLLGRTTRVGSYEKAYPHPWGLCDLHGNVWEWCENKHEDAKDGHVLRGGSWNCCARDCRSALRPSTASAGPINECGCRICLRLD